MNSSGTSSANTSKIYMDKDNAKIQTKILKTIVSDFIGKSRMPMLIIDSEAIVKTGGNFSARTAGIVGFSIFGKDHTFALNDQLEIDIEVLKNTLMKHYLLDFHTYCSKLDGESSEMMCELLSSRSDRDTINLTLNSFNTPLNDVLVRSRLYPTIGHLYPAGTELISKSMDEQKLLDSLKSYNEYYHILEKMNSGDEFNVDDEFYKMEGTYSFHCLCVVYLCGVQVFFFCFPI